MGIALIAMRVVNEAPAIEVREEFSTRNRDQLARSVSRGRDTVSVCDRNSSTQVARMRSVRFECGLRGLPTRRFARWIFLGLCAVTLSGCAHIDYVNVVSWSMPNSAKSYVLRNTNVLVAEGSDEYRRMAVLAKKVLANHGLREVSAGVGSEMIVEVDFGVVPRISGGGVNFNASKIPPTISLPRSIPTGTDAAARDETAEVVWPETIQDRRPIVYGKYLKLIARRNPEGKGADVIGPIWSVEVRSEATMDDDSSKVSPQLPAFFVAVNDYLGRNSQGRERLTIERKEANATLAGL